MTPSNPAIDAQHLCLDGPVRETVARANVRFRDLLLRYEEPPELIGVVLAGGAATRFRPLTSSRHMVEQGLAPASDGFSLVPWAKPALPLVREPLIRRTVRDLAAMGCPLVLVNVGRHLAPERIIESLGDGSWLGPRCGLAYLVEESPSGTYGGVMHMLDLALELRPLPPRTRVAIFSGDIYTEQEGAEILRFHEEHDADLSIMLNPVPHAMKREFGTVLLDGSARITEFREKDPHSPSNLNNSSRYLARLDLLERFRCRLGPLPQDKDRHRDEGLFFDFGMHIFPLLLREGTTGGFWGFVSDKKWADLGRVIDYLRTSVELLEKGQVCCVHPEARLIGSELRIEGPNFIDASCTLSGSSSLSHAAIGAGWTVADSVLERVVLLPLPEGTRFRIEGCRLEDCVVACGDLYNLQERGRLLVFDGVRMLSKEV